MKPLIAALLLALVAAPAMAGDVVDTTFVKTEGSHAFNVRDLVMMDRVSDPQLSPDGRYAAFGVRSTDYAANKGVNAIYVLDWRKGGQPVKVVDKGGSARWSADGRSLYFVAPAKGVAQLWRVDLGGKGGLNLAKHAAAVQVSHARWIWAATSCRRMASRCCCRMRCSPTAPRWPAPSSVSTRAQGQGQRHAVQQAVRAALGHLGRWSAQPVVCRPLRRQGPAGGRAELLSRGIDGDVPSKPFGDDERVRVSRRTARPCISMCASPARSEPWSTNFDVYSVPADGSAAPKNLTADNKAWDAYPVPSPDGKTLYYLAMKTPGFEADRFAHHGAGSGHRRETRSGSAVGSFARRPDDFRRRQDAVRHRRRQRPASAVRDRRGQRQGSAAGRRRHGGRLSMAAGKLLLARDDLKRPADRLPRRLPTAAT